MNHDTDRTPNDVIIEPLSSCLPPNAGKVRIIHDASLARPLRVRDSAGVKLSKEVHAATADRIARIDEQFWPLPIVYLRATASGSAGTPVTLDAGRLGTLPRLFFARAATNDALHGLELDIRPHLRVVPGRGGRRAIDTTLDVRTVDPSDDDDETEKALGAFGRWATQAWSNAVASTLAPWLLQSGVTDLRFRGVMRPDRRQQLAVLYGETWPEPRAH